MQEFRSALLLSPPLRDLEFSVKHEIFHVWKDDIVGNKRTADDDANIKALEGRLSGVQRSQKDNTARVMNRMNAGNDTSLVTTVWQSWLTFHRDYQKDKDMEDRVKRSEQQVQAFLKKQGDSAKSVLAAASSGSDSAVIVPCWQAWVSLVNEAKAEAEMAELLNGADSKFAAISGKGKENGKTALEKASYHVNMMYLIRHFVAWKLDTKEKKTLRTLQVKIDKKREQLVGIQDMFRKFASKLEGSFKGNQDSSRDYKARGLNKGDGSVSLPDIHTKQGSGRMGPSSGNRSGSRQTQSPKYAQGAYPGDSPVPQQRFAYAT